MYYLRLRRSQIILASFVILSLLLTAFPGVDLVVSKIFFHGSFQQTQWWQRLLHEGVGWFIGVSLLLVVALYAWNRLAKKNLCRVDGKRVVYLFLVLIIGAGLIVNVAFKDHFGRARPRDVAEFGGSKVFTPPFVMSNECTTNCSFSSGDGAAGFFSLALALALSRKRWLFAAALAIGVLVSYARISAGAHFFSDTVVSFFVMLIVADVLFYYMVLTDGERDALKRPKPTPLPALLVVPAVQGAEITREA
jgi:lipid A 4'-phosphatase